MLSVSAAARNLGAQGMRRLAALLLLPLLACEGSSPTAPEEPAPQMTLRFHRTAPAEEQTARRVWAEVAQCMGLPEQPRLTIHFTMEDAAIECGKVPAAGCTFIEPEIRVHVWREYAGAPYYAERHEFIHAQEWMERHYVDYDHSGPVWAQCEVN